MILNIMLFLAFYSLLMITLVADNMSALEKLCLSILVMILGFGAYFTRQYWTDIGSEFVAEISKTLIVSFFGFIGYVLFQLHKSKQTYTTLYVFVAKLEQELLNCLVLLRPAAKEYEEYAKLSKTAEIHDEPCRSFMEKVRNISNYETEDFENDSEGNIFPVGSSYSVRPYGILESLSHEQQWLSFQDGNHKEELERNRNDEAYWNKRTIYDEFADLRAALPNVLDSTHSHVAYVYIDKALRRFDELHDDSKRDAIDPFCKRLLQEDNPFSDLYKKYKRFLLLDARFTNTNDSTMRKIKCRFENWCAPNADLISAIDLNAYLALEAFYAKYRDVNVPISNVSGVAALLEVVEKTQKQVVTPLKERILFKIKWANRLFLGALPDKS